DLIAAGQIDIAPAVTAMGADIESGPVVNWRLRAGIVGGQRDDQRGARCCQFGRNVLHDYPPRVTQFMAFSPIDQLAQLLSRGPIFRFYCAVDCDLASTITPGFITPAGSSAALAPANAAPNSSGRCWRYHFM